MIKKMENSEKMIMRKFLALCKISKKNFKFR